MLTKDEFEAYRATLDAIAKDAVSDLRRQWGSFDLSNPESVLDDLLEGLPDIIAIHGDDAAVLALEFYEHLRLKVYKSPFNAMMPERVGVEDLERPLRERLDPLFSGGYAAAAARQVQAFLAKLVLRQAGAAISQSARSDKEKVSCASIPRPGCTCKFCLSFAAMGFVFDKRGDAKGKTGVWHDNCRCQLLPKFGDQQAPGWYDPERYQKLYDYLNDGTISVQKGASPLEKELDVGIWLSDAGHVVRFLKPSNKFKDRRPDSLVDGVLFEIKVPDGNRKDNTVSAYNALRQFESASGQSDRLIISHHKIADLISYEDYRQKVIIAAQDWPQFRQVWLVAQSGKIEEIR
jgi:hypothetical protein